MSLLFNHLMHNSKSYRTINSTTKIQFQLVFPFLFTSRIEFFLLLKELEILLFAVSSLLITETKNYILFRILNNKYSVCWLRQPSNEISNHSFLFCKQQVRNDCIARIISVYNEQFLTSSHTWENLSRETTRYGSSCIEKSRNAWCLRKMMKNSIICICHSFWSLLNICYFWSFSCQK